MQQVHNEKDHVKMIWSFFILYPNVKSTNNLKMLTSKVLQLNFDLLR